LDGPRTQLTNIFQMNVARFSQRGNLLSFFALESSPAI
jgi:hypothetical protein